MITDYHVHLETGPYTIEWVEEYLKVANNRGVNDLGFSEHGYRFKQARSMFNNPWIEERQTEDLDEYVGLVLEAKKLGLPVKLGIELDYIPGKEKEIEEFLKPYPWDYVIGSVHWINDWGFDLEIMKDRWEEKPIIASYQEYFNILEKMLDSNLFDILGHIDVIKVYGHKPDIKDVQTLNTIYDNIVSKIKGSNISVEVSTAGLRKPVGELYPDPEIMKRLADNNIPLIINSDAHKPEHVGEDFNKGIKYIKDYAINQISTFNNRRRTIVDLG